MNHTLDQLSHIFLGASRTRENAGKAATTMKSKQLGRRSLLTPAMQKRICGLLAKGNTIITTCDTVGISVRTYHEWCEKQPHFLHATSRARGDARIKLVKVLTDAAKIDWRAAGWLLSHCWPSEFSELQRQEIGIVGGVVLIPQKRDGAE
jgi:hypothetical protein